MEEQVKLIDTPLTLYFVGDNFYWRSGTAMSSIYEAGTHRRSDWGMVQIACSEGRTVVIRPATAEEMQARLADLGKLAMR